MEKCFSRRGAAVFGFVLAVVGAFGTTARAAPFRLTTPPTSTMDDWPDVVAVGTGFQLAWQHYETTGYSSVLTRRFTSTGASAGAATRVQAPTTLIGHPRLLPAASGKLGLLWLEMTYGVSAASIDVASGAIGPHVGITRPSAAIYDVARLSNGRVAIVDTYIDISNTSNIRVRAAHTQTTPAFALVKKDQKLPGSDNPLTTPASPDQAVVSDGAGGSIVAYRDRNDGNLYLVKVSAAGVPAATRTRLNTTATKVGGAAPMATFGVAAVRFADGRFAVAWTSLENADDATSALRLRYLDATGNPVGKDQRVNASTVGSQTSTRLVALPNGRLGVAWIQDEGTTRFHRIRWYTAAGAPLAAPVTLRSDTELLDMAGIRMTRMSDGRILQVWRSYDAGLARYVVKGEFLTPPN